MQQPEIAIEIIGVSKEYSYKEENSVINSKWALNNINLTIKKGEVLGIIGPNGSGKTTLLKMLGGTIKPTEGKIIIKGKIASIIDIGSGINPELSGYDNIFFMGNLYGFSNTELNDKIENIIEFSGIRESIHTPVKTYSNGMYLRLAFSILTHLDFDIYLFDEVISVGDFEFQEKCKYQFEKLIQQKKTIILVTHHLQQLMEGFTYIHVLKEGQIVYSGNYFNSLNKHIDGFDENLDFYKNEYSFKSYTLENSQMKEKDVLEDESIEFIFKFLVKVQTAPQKIQFGFVLYNQMSVPIFSSFINLSNDAPFHLSAYIPNKILLKGKYYIDAYMRDQEDISNFIKIKKVLSFNIASTKDIESTYIGTIKPELKWTVKQL